MQGSLLNPIFNEVDYAVNGDILTLGRIYFKVEKLDKKNELILVDYDPSFPEDDLVRRHYFKK